MGFDLSVMSEQTSHFAAADGTPDAPGTSAQPWDLATALAGAGGAVQPGHTVWLRGGTYPGNWSCALNGREGARITFRAYPGERVILQGPAGGNV